MVSSGSLARHWQTGAQLDDVGALQACVRVLNACEFDFIQAYFHSGSPNWHLYHGMNPAHHNMPLGHTATKQLYLESYHCSLWSISSCELERGISVHIIINKPLL